MAAITDYASLVAAVSKRLGRADINTASAEDVVQMAQLRVIRDVVNRGGVLVQDETVTGTLSIGVAELALPTGYQGTRTLKLTGDCETTLHVVAFDVLTEKHTGKGAPKAYAVYGGNIVLGPTPDQDYAYQWLYTKDIPRLASSGTGTVTTNYLTTNAPDVIFYATLLEMCDQARDAESIQRYTQAYAYALDALCKNVSKQRYADMPPQLSSGYRGRYNIYSDRNV